MPNDIDPCLCTHLLYAFATMTNDYKIATFEWNDVELYSQFNGLKDKWVCFAVTQPSVPT